MHRWKQDFCTLLNSGNTSVNENVFVEVGKIIEQDTGNSTYCQDFSIFDVQNAILDVKKNRAVGVDEMPGEVLKNDTVIKFLHKLFNACFQTGNVPSIWNKILKYYLQGNQNKIKEKI